jgi:MoaA/NifB/PqqE/SkfB family radical SAM enzyme
MIKFQDVKVIQFEVSNYCNAACPQCPRNYFGGATIATLPLKKWSLQEFKKIFSAQLIAQLEEIYFCGTYGDPMTNQHILSMCCFLKESNSKIRVGIHTNGGVGNIRKYQELAKTVDFIAFGIDGLANTNHIYRRDVVWNRVMENSTEFINSGGYAIWDYIVFEHNQHQVDDARLLSQNLKFKEFNVKKTSRFLKRNHIFNNRLDVYNSNGNIDYTISLPSNKKYINTGYHSLNKIILTQPVNEYANNTSINCNAFRIKEIYIGADGFVFPCGWLHDRLYGPEEETHSDRALITDLMIQAGGNKYTNIFYSSLEEILQGPWFDIIKQSWTNDNRLERCGVMCGSDINLIKDQNINITYKK